MILLIVLFILLIASIQDLKKKMVSDYLIYFFLFLTIIYVLYLILTKNILDKLLLPLILNFLIYLGYRFRLWAIGDLYILFILLFYVSIFSKDLIQFFSFFIYLSIVLLIYTFLFSIYFIIKLKIKKEVFEILKKKFYYLILPFPLIFYPKLFLLLFLASLTYLLYQPLKDKFVFERTPYELVEGDWVAENIIVDGKIIIKKDNPGLTKKDIELLKKLYEEGKVKTVKIIEGIPMIPSIFISFLLWLIFKEQIIFFLYEDLGVG